MSKRKWECPECETELQGYFDETSQNTVRYCSWCGWENV